MPYDEVNSDKTSFLSRTILVPRVLVSNYIYIVLRFEVFRAEFRKDGCLYGSYDLVVGDWETLSHWGFVINNGFEPSSEDDRLFSDRELQEKLQKQFGRCNNVAVLYKGKSSISRFGTVYLNIYDFLSSLESNRDMGKVFKELLEGISKLDK